VSKQWISQYFSTEETSAASKSHKANPTSQIDRKKCPMKQGQISEI